MKKTKYLGWVKNGQIISDRCWENDQALSPLEGKRIEFDIAEAGNTRRDVQNRYYWAVVIPNAMGCFLENGKIILDKDECHGVFAKAFWSREVEGLGIITKSTTKMSVEQFSNYIKKIIEFLLDTYNWTTPEPRERGVF